MWPEGVKGDLFTCKFAIQDTQITKITPIVDGRLSCVSVCLSRCPFQAHGRLLRFNPSILSP